MSWERVANENFPLRYLFELRSVDGSSAPSWPLAHASSLVIAAREAARARLVSAFPGRIEDVDCYLVGRKRAGKQAVPAANRIRIVALPTADTCRVERAVRHLLVESPRGCAFRGEDVLDAFAGARISAPETGEPTWTLMAAVAGDEVHRQYGIGSKFRVFRTVTPVAFGGASKRPRVQALLVGDASSAMTTATAEARAAFVDALRHAGIRAPVDSIEVQRVPFELDGLRAGEFQVPLGTDGAPRFLSDQLWHAEVVFSRGVSGPLVLGDGRFCGLGVLAPVQDGNVGVHSFSIRDGLVGQPDAVGVARALRRAVMSRVQSVIGAGRVMAPFFSGHAEDGAPIHRADAAHLSFAFDPTSHQLIVLSPHFVERRPATVREWAHMRTLGAALKGFSVLRAGSAGHLSLADDANPGWLTARSRVWTTATCYVVTRHRKARAAVDALRSDVMEECLRVGLPKPKVIVRSTEGRAGVGLTGDVKLVFEQDVSGPILLGKTRHLGGGLFVPMNDAGR